jgi:hypothetical protein
MEVTHISLLHLLYKQCVLKCRSRETAKIRIAEAAEAIGFGIAQACALAAWRLALGGGSPSGFS